MKHEALKTKRAPQIIAEIKAKRETEQKARANELLSRQGGWYD